MAEDDDKIPMAAGKGALFVSSKAWNAMRRAVLRAGVLPDPRQFEVKTQGGKTAFSLRQPPGAPANWAGGPPPPFTLGMGEDGAKIYKGLLEYTITVLNFERFHLEEGISVNSLAGQDSIKGVSKLEPGGDSGEEDDETGGWTRLDWFGDVWLYWEVDEETGTPSFCEFRGPDKPETREVGELSAELERGSEGEEETGSGAGPSYCVRIGSVSEDGVIEQERTGNVVWDFTFVPENPNSSESSESSPSSPSSSESSSTPSSPSSGPSSPGSSDGSSPGSSGGSSPGGSSDNGSGKSSSAIVPDRLSSTGYTALFVEEAGDVRFNEYVMDVPVTGRKVEVEVEPHYVEVCVPGSLRVFSACGDRPAMIGGRVEGGRVKLEVETMGLPLPGVVQIKLSGIRRGFADRTKWRYPERTPDEFQRNEAFIKLAHPQPKKKRERKKKA